MNKKLSILLLFSLAFSLAKSQKLATDDAVVGVWKGTSICQIKNSPCHDEVVVYYITKVKGVDSFDIDARKIVNGKEDDMGILSCKFDRKNSRLISNSYGLWTFNIKGNNIDGTLYHDGKLYRIVKLSRA